MSFFYGIKQCNIFCIQEPAQYVQVEQAGQAGHTLAKGLDRGGLDCQTVSEVSGDIQLSQAGQVIQGLKEIPVPILGNLVIPWKI